MIFECLVSLISVAIVCGNPPETRAQPKRFQTSLSQQNLHTVLNSIDDRLRNLDNAYAIQYPSTGLEGKLTQFGRKLDGMEAKITRLETVVTNEIEKLLASLSGRSFKDDIANDHVIRKIDNAYERLSHRVVFSEGKIDMSEKKLENKLNTIMAKLDKLEDGLLLRDNDVQEEISEVFATVEEVRLQSDNVLEKLDNVTKSMKGIQESATIRKNYNVNNVRNVSDNYVGDVKKQLESISEKMTNFHEYSWATNNRIESYLRSIGLVANQSRYEVQSGLRSLTIEVGRMAGNQHIIHNPKGIEILQDLEKKMENNFNSIMMTQSTFLENCYRVQSDEAQVESKISEALEKLLDVFFEKAAERENIGRIEQMLKNHDQYMRKSLIDTIKTVASLSQKDTNFEKKFDNTIATITSSLESLQTLLNERIVDETLDEKLEEIISSLKELETLSIDINTNIKTTIREVFPDTQELKILIQKLQLQTKNSANEDYDSLNRTLQEIRNKLTLVLPRNPIVNNTEIIFNSVNCLDLSFDVRSTIANCTNSNTTDSITFPNDSNNTVDCLDLPIDIRSLTNCDNSTMVINQTVTRDPSVDKLITEIFLTNFTMWSNQTAPDSVDTFDNLSLSDLSNGEPQNSGS